MIDSTVVRITQMKSDWAIDRRRSWRQLALSNSDFPVRLRALISPMLRQLTPHKSDALRQLPHAIDAILDAYPTIECRSPQFAEDGVVVIESPANGSVAKPFRVAFDSAFFATQVLKRSVDESPIARMHRDHAVFHAPQ
jgi:hypothetical protein